MGDEPDDVAEELRRVRDEARTGAQSAGDADPDPGLATTPPRGDRPPPPARETAEEEEPGPAPPDAAAVNAAWRAEADPPRGRPGLLRRLLERLLRPRLEAQRTFNARQVQLDNEMLEYFEKRSAATHRHYDRLLGELGRRLDDSDERHVVLERELVEHVQDLVRRIDLVLADGSRGRLALEFALEEARERLARVEKTLRRPE